MIKRAVTAAAASAVLLAADLAIGGSPASAYATFGHKLTYGVGNYGSSNQHYYIDSSASGYTSMINTAMDQWIYTTGPWGITTPISYTRTTTKSSSRMDHYLSSNIHDWWGLTTFWSGDSTVEPTEKNWVWNKVWLDGDFANCPNRRGVIAHEEGHAMGLAHVSSGTAVMRTTIGQGGLNNITRAQPDDLNGINHLY
jgi:hypothetical protein